MNKIKKILIIKKKAKKEKIKEDKNEIKNEMKNNNQIIKKK